MTCRLLCNVMSMLKLWCSDFAQLKMKCSLGKPGHPGTALRCSCSLEAEGSPTAARPLVLCRAAALVMIRAAGRPRCLIPAGRRQKPTPRERTCEACAVMKHISVTCRLAYTAATLALQARHGLGPKAHAALLTTFWLDKELDPPRLKILVVTPIAPHRGDMSSSRVGSSAAPTSCDWPSPRRKPRTPA